MMGLSGNDGERKSGVDGSTAKQPGERGFYIGWQAVAPKRITGFVKKFLAVLLVFFGLLGMLLAISQKKFGTGNFEFGTLTAITGVYFDKPVACIKVITGKDIWGDLSIITIPLVGYGKHGAGGIITEIEKEKKISLNQKEITLQGTLLYNDGKTLLQVAREDNADIKVSPVAVVPAMLSREKEIGMRTVKGEIMDPKCYFGVMKPAEGKPHRDCAIRCILGGISPMMAVKNEKGEANYYLLVAAEGHNIAEEVKDYVGEPVSINATLVQYDDWIIAYIDSKEKIKRYAYLESAFGNTLQSCASNCTK